MSVTTGVSSDYWKTPTITDTTNTSGTNNLSDFNSFMKLLATQLSNQDPLDPISSTEYVSQMAQITSLQQLQNINSSLISYQALELLDKEVTYQMTDASGAGFVGSGTVQAVLTLAGNTYLNIDGNLISYDAVIQVNGSGDY